MNSSILVLVNLPETAERTARVAAALGAPLDLPLVLLHLDVYPVLLEAELVMAAAEQTARNEAETIAGLWAMARRLPVAAEVVESGGIMSDAVEAAITQYRPLFLAMGLSVEHDLLDNLLRNQVLPVLRATHQPLLLVPEAAISARTPRRVLLAIDGEPFTPTAAALALAPLLAAWEATYTVVCVTSPDALPTSPAKTAMANLQASGLLPPDAAIELYEELHLSPSDGVLQAIDFTQADLLVLFARPRGFLDRLFHSSVTSQVLRHSRVPVWMLPVAAAGIPGATSGRPTTSAL